MKIRLESFRDFLEGELFEILVKRKDQLQPVEDIGQEELSYLVGMLSRFVSSQYFFQHFTNSPLYDFALRQNSETPQTALTGLGDFCLFRTGFFPLGYNGRHSVPRKNYILAGQKAYWSVYDRQSQSLVMFRSLALNFLIFSNLISEIRLRYMTEQEIWALYEFWQETDSEFAAELLRMKNIVPQRFSHLV